MKRYKVLTPIKFSEELRYEPGDEIELEGREAMRMPWALKEIPTDAPATKPKSEKAAP